MVGIETELFAKTQAGANPGSAKIMPNDPGPNLIANSPAVILRVQETGEFINIDDSGWARIEKFNTTKYIMVPYSQESYIVIANGRFKNSYLSYNDRYYVGAYNNWSDARYWAINPINCSRYPGLYNYRGFLCCNGVTDAIDKLIIVAAY